MGHLLSVMSRNDVINWKHFPRYWPFVRGIHQPPVNSPYKGQWRETLMFSLMWAWTNSWIKNRDAGDLRRHHAHYDITVIWCAFCLSLLLCIRYRVILDRVIRRYWMNFTLQHIEVETRWPPFCLRRFQRHFRECKSSYFDLNVPKVHS